MSVEYREPGADEMAKVIHTGLLGFGKLGSKVAMLFREEPGQQVMDDLRHFKQVMETGEIVLSDATKQRGMHPAQPDDKPVEL